MNRPPSQKLYRVFKCISLVALLLVFAASPGLAESECRSFPANAFLTTHTHARVEAYVDSRLKGDWSRFLGTLHNQLSTLTTHHAGGDSVRLRLGHRKVILKGRQLAAYIHASKLRYRITECLAERKNPLRLDQFVTASGGETLSRSSINPKSIRLNIAVTSTCRGSDTIIRVKNTGHAWPKKGDLTIHNVGPLNLRQTTARPMRMKHNQVATFRVPKSKNPTGRVGVFVKPSWYERAFKLDANVACG